MGLDESYSHTRGQILLMQPIPPINKVFSLILQEEKQHEVSATSVPATQVAFQVKNPKPTTDPKQKVAKKDRPLCSHYRILDHSG